MRAALRLVWALDVKHLAAHRTRLALSVLGIAVGVALAVGIGALTSSIQGSLRAIAGAAASDANIEVQPNGRAGIPSDLLGRVRSMPGVRNAGATIESYVQLRRGRHSVRTLALGIDQGILRMTPRAVPPETVRSADPFGLIVPPSIARDLDVTPGRTVQMTTPTGWRSIHVGTVLPARFAARSRVVVGTVGVLQQLLGRGTTYDAIYVDAADPEATLPVLQRVVGDVGRAGPVAFRSDQIQKLLGAANASFSVGTLVALFVGAFLVYNTMSMAAVERLREAALLRAIGAKRKQVFALFVAEGGLLGLLGSAAGVGGGVLLARILLTQRGGALEQIYPIQITTLEIPLRLIAGAGAAGVVAALVAALLPARRIARADPAPALGPSGKLEDPTRGPRRLTTAVGAACAIVGPAITVPSVAAGEAASPLTFLGMSLTLLAIALLIPLVVPAVATVLVGGLGRLRRTPGLVRLASQEVLRSPGRTSYTTGAVLLSLAIVVGFSIAQSSFGRAFDVGFKDIISADLYVRSPTWQIFGSDVPLDEHLVDKIESVPGVKGAWPFRLMTATIENHQALVLAYNVDKFARLPRRGAAARAEFAAQAAALNDPNAVLASTSLLSQLGHKLGETITLPTPTGRHRLRLAASIDDPSAINPEIVLDHRAFVRMWGFGGADSFGVVVDRPTDAVRVQTEIARRLGPRYGLVVDTNAQYLKRLSGAVNSVQQLIGSVQLMAVIVAGLGLANTLLISTLERTRDLGVLRAVGMLRRQVRRMVAAEAVLIGTIGVLLAWGLGTLIGLAMFAFTQAQLGLPIRLVLPASGYIGAAVLGVAAALAASWYPARRAARLDVVEALQYE